jgi:threonine dehydrogenase-like Zn-dependent dehydrogenase
VLATCIHAQDRMPFFPGEAVVVLGLGVTGLLHVQLAKRRGATPIIAVTRSAAKLELARALGADVLIEADGSEVEAVMDASEGGVDLVIEAVGSMSTFARAIEMVRVGGRILAYGTITDASGDLPLYDLYYKEISLEGARSARAEDFPAAIRVVAQGEVALEPLLSSRFPLESVGDAIRTAGTAGTLKVLIDV